MEGEAERVARDHFAALARRDLQAARAHLAEDLRGTMHGLAAFDGAGSVMDYFAAVFAALPDWQIEVLRTVAAGDGARRWPAASARHGSSRSRTACGGCAVASRCGR